MPLDLNNFLSERAIVESSSEVRDLLKYSKVEGMIYMAGGLPAPESFPMDDIIEIAIDVFKKSGPDAMQYGETIGYRGLREELKKYLNRNNVPVRSVEEVMITSGSQQALDLTARAFIDPGDYVIVEDPTYLAELGVLKKHKANIIPVEMEADGIKIDDFEDILKSLKREGKRLKFLYSVPTFQNPAGITMSTDKRKRVVELANEYDFLIIEDDPYSRLNFDGDFVLPIKYFDKEGRVIYMITFSKLFAPAWRVSGTAAHPEIIDRLVKEKQSADLFTETPGQYILEKFIKGGYLERHIPNIIRLYEPRRDAMNDAIEDRFKCDHECNKPLGGMFHWVTFCDGISTKEIQQKALAKKVAYCSSVPFRPKGQANGMRLNHTNQTPEKIYEGIGILAELFNEKFT